MWFTYVDINKEAQLSPPFSLLRLVYLTSTTVCFDLLLISLSLIGNIPLLSLSSPSHMTASSYTHVEIFRRQEDDNTVLVEWKEGECDLQCLSLSYACGVHKKSWYAHKSSPYMSFLLLIRINCTHISHLLSHYYHDTCSLFLSLLLFSFYILIIQ